MKQSCVPQASNWSTIFKVCILFRVENQNTQCRVYCHMGRLFPPKHINWSTEHQRAMPPGWKHLNTTKSIIFIFARTIYYIVCLPVAKHGYCASVLKGDLVFADEEGVPRGHPQALTLVPLGYFLGWHGHPQAWAFVYSLSYLIILQCLHLKTSFIQNLRQFY
jgi:hypothetical protein